MSHKLISVVRSEFISKLQKQSSHGQRRVASVGSILNPALQQHFTFADLKATAELQLRTRGAIYEALHSELISALDQKFSPSLPPQIAGQPWWHRVSAGTWGRSQLCSMFSLHLQESGQAVPPRDCLEKSETMIITVHGLIEERGLSVDSHTGL